MACSLRLDCTVGFGIFATTAFQRVLKSGVSVLAVCVSAGAGVAGSKVGTSEAGSVEDVEIFSTGLTSGAAHFIG